MSHGANAQLGPAMAADHAGLTADGDASMEIEETPQLTPSQMAASLVSQDAGRNAMPSRRQNQRTLFLHHL